MSLPPPGYRYSTQTIPADGVTDTFQINFAGGYLDKDYVYARAYDADTDLNSTPLTVEFVSESEQSATVKVTPVQAVGRNVEIFRYTPRAAPLVDFKDRSMLTAENLNTITLQAIQSVAELEDQSQATREVVLDAREAVEAIADKIDEVYQQALADIIANYYLVPVPYVGGLRVDRPVFTVSYNGTTFAANPEAIPFTTGVVFNPTQWRVLQSVDRSELGSAAYTNASDYATAVQGALADTATQPEQLATLQLQVEQQLAAVLAGQQGSALYFDTKANMDAVPGTFVHQGAFVSMGEDAGQYSWDGAAWVFLRGDTLDSKADKTALATLAGVAVPGVRGGYIEVDMDPMGKTSFGILPDGTREFISTKVGSYTVKRSGADAVEAGTLTNRGVYTQYALDLTGTRFSDALEIDIDSLGRVGRIMWKDGTVTSKPRGYFQQDFQLNGINARVTTSDGYGYGDDTLIILCHGNTKNYTYAPSVAFQAWAKANRVSYACISLQEGTTGWGNDTTRQRIVALYNYLMQNFQFQRSVVLVGNSMGGLTMGQLAYYKPFPIRFCLGIGPVPSLNYIFDAAPARKAPIRSAYGMDAGGSDDTQAAAFFSGYDWFNMGQVGQQKIGFPRMHLYAGSGDTTYQVDFGGATNYPIIQQSLRNAGGFCALTVIPSVSHDADVLWDRVLADGIFTKE